jgi:hypothetical protein
MRRVTIMVLRKSGEISIMKRASKDEAFSIN